MELFCFINGDIVPSKKAVISIYDLGLLRGYAAFDYLRTYNGIPFRLEDHLKRFRHSAGEFNLALNYTDRKIAGIIKKLMELSAIQNAGIRLILTGGFTTDSITMVDPNFIISIEKLPESNPGIYTKGIKLITYDYQRLFPESKTTEYKIAIKLQKLRESENAYDILYVHNGVVLETTRSNIFILNGNQLITPKDGVLPGITRKTVIELAQGHFEVLEKTVTLTDLLKADEVFISGSTKMIIPVTKINSHKIRAGIPGPKTGFLLELFKDYALKWK